MDLGRSPSVTKEAPKKKFYPTIYMDGLSKDNPLVKKDVGESCDAEVTFKVVSKTQGSDGKWSVNLEVRDMSTRRSC